MGEAAFKKQGEYVLNKREQPLTEQEFRAVLSRVAWPVIQKMDKANQTRLVEAMRDPLFYEARKDLNDADLEASLVKFLQKQGGTKLEVAQPELRQETPAYTSPEAGARAAEATEQETSKVREDISALREDTGIQEGGDLSDEEIARRMEAKKKERTGRGSTPKEVPQSTAAERAEAIRAAQQEREAAQMAAQQTPKFKLDKDKKWYQFWK